MSINAPSLYTQEFATNIALLSQQRLSVFESAVMFGSHTGEQASPVNQVGSIEMQPVNNRFQAKTRTRKLVQKGTTTRSSSGRRQRSGARASA